MFVGFEAATTFNPQPLPATQSAKIICRNLKNFSFFYIVLTNASDWQSQFKLILVEMKFLSKYFIIIMIVSCTDIKKNDENYLINYYFNFSPES